MTTAPTECVLFCSGLGGAAAFWDPQLEAFGSRFRVITYDQRGTGQDRAALPHGYAVANMADEAAALLDRLGIASCQFVGHALGGAVGLELARRHPGRVERLAVVNGWGWMDPHTERCFDARLAILDAGGIPAYVRAQAIFLYPPSWSSANAGRLATEEASAIAHLQDAGNLRTRIAALRAWNPTPWLSGLDLDVLALAAMDDVLVPWTASQTLAERLPRSRVVLLPDGGHACTITRSDASNAALMQFLAR